MKASKKLINELEAYKRILTRIKFETLDMLTVALNTKTPYHKDTEIRKAMTYIKENLK